jgi:uncharacterized protein YecT (DUF1311 family)
MAGRRAAWLGRAALLAVWALLPSAVYADALGECGVMTEGEDELRQCLRTQLSISEQAMATALEAARQNVREVDQAMGQEIAELGLAASQQAWAAFRDAECGLRSALTGSGAAAEGLEVACRIEMTRERTDALAELGAPT